MWRMIVWSSMVGPVFSTIAAGNGFAPGECTVRDGWHQLKHRDLEQSHICLGMNGVPVADPRRFAASLLNTILGGQHELAAFSGHPRGAGPGLFAFTPF
jgi:hypothetical protein